jgi:prepilin signal peptidase PulO-like enzyme (type II secretory pathway)
MEFILLIKILLVFSLGACLGSFLNVLVDRGQKGKSLLGWSQCDHCGYRLRWYDNVPVFSFLFLHGRCRKCGQKLSWQYPIVELGMGFLFLAVGYSVGFLDLVPTSQSYFDAWEILFVILTVFLLAAVFLWDLKYMIIPDELVLAGLSIAFFYSVYQQFSLDVSWLDIRSPVVSGLAGSLIVSGFFYLIYFISKKKWIGGGDVKLGLWIGWLSGWQMAYLMLLVAYVLGAAVSVALLALKKKKMNSQVPFGPFLILGCLVVLFWGESVIQWWREIIFNF